MIPPTYPAALSDLRMAEEKIRSLRAALDFGTIPAWVIGDVLAENERLRAHLSLSELSMFDNKSE